VGKVNERKMYLRSLTKLVFVWLTSLADQLYAGQEVQVIVRMRKEMNDGLRQEQDK
jgi:hypothetical protein